MTNQQTGTSIPSHSYACAAEIGTDTGAYPHTPRESLAISETNMKKIVSKKRIVELVDRFPEAQVFIIGDIMVDHFIWGKVSRISPEAPVPVVRVTSESLLLGGAANVLNNIFALGGRAWIAGVIGSDGMGSWIQERLKELNVDIGGITVSKQRPTSVKTRIIAHNQQVVRFDREDHSPISTKDRKRVTEYLEKRSDRIGAVVISDYNKGVVTEELVREVAKIAGTAKIPLYIDPKRNGFGLYRDCDLITPNLAEASLALGKELNSQEDIVEGGRKLMEEYRFGSLLVTRSEEGMTLFERNGDVIHIPAVAKEVYDVTGAGDTVIGTIALAVAAGASLKEAAALANCAAGIAVGKVGTAAVTREELLRAL